jgi:hypothetical protein
MCKLWETEGRHREFAFPSFLYSFRTPTTPIFWGFSHGEPQTPSVSAPLTIEGVRPPVRCGLGARFRPLDRRAELTIALKRCGAGWTHGSVVK